MSQDAECPYCQTENFIDEFPGEDRETEVECKSCGKPFVAVGQVTTYFASRCADGDHDFSKATATLVFCSRCDAFERRHAATSG